MGVDVLAIQDSVMITPSFTGGKYISTNYGQTWRKIIITSSDEGSFYDVQISGNLIYANDLTKLYVSNDWGENWAIEPFDFTEYTLFIKTILPKGDSVYLGTTENGVFSLPFDRNFCVNPPRPSITATNLNSDKPVLTSSAANGNQWFLNGLLLEGATGSTLEAIGSGTYTVVSTINGCASEVSEGFVLVITGAEEKSTSPNVQLFPNPVQQALYVLVEGVQTVPVRFEIIDCLGQVVRAQVGETNRQEALAMHEASAGLYIIRIYTPHTVITRQVVKQ